MNLASELKVQKKLLINIKMIIMFICRMQDNSPNSMGNNNDNSMISFYFMKNDILLRVFYNL